MLSFINKAHQSLTRHEKLFLWLTIILILALSSTSLIVAWLTTPIDKIFTGVLGGDGADIMVYLSQIEEASRGRFLLHNLYTSESSAGLILSPLWLVLGWIKGITGISSLFLFHASRVIFGGAFLYFLYLYISRFFSSVIWCRICFLMTCFGSGLGVIYLLVNLAAVPVSIMSSVDLWLTQSHILTIIMHSPLFIVSIGLLLLIFWWAEERLSVASIKETMIMGAVTLLLGLIHPYDLIIIGAVLVVWFLCRCLIEKKWLKQELWKLIIVGLVSGLAVVYFWWLLKSDPAVAAWAKQNITLSPPLIYYLWGLGIILPLFLVGAMLATKRHWQNMWFLVAWGIVGLILLYAPVQFQRRLVNGLIIPLTILGVAGLMVIWQKLRGVLVKTTLVIIMVFLLLPSTLFNIAFDILTKDKRIYKTTNGQEAYAYLPHNIYNSFFWIRHNFSDDQVVLSSAAMGVFIPYLGGSKVYLGHHHQTGDFVNKRQKVEEWFFTDNNNDEQKIAWLKDQGINYVFWGPAEQALGTYAPNQKSYLHQVYSYNNVSIYKVK